MKRIVSLLIVLVMALSIVPAVSFAAEPDLENFTGLVIKAPSGAKVNLHTGIWARGDESAYVIVTPDATRTVDGYTYRYYLNASGSYHVRASQSGYITLYKDIYMSDAEAATKTVEEITLDKKSTNGFAPSTMYSHTTEVLENADAWKSEASMFPKYAPYLENPIFQEGRHPQQMTTNEEMEAFIASLDQKNDHMYVFSLGKSDQYGYNIPAVIFTKSDLSSATTLEEAAALIDNSRVNIFYRAQIHGNEPAGGEGALAMINYLQKGYGEKILDKVNLVIIPRLSPDGSYLYQRALCNSSHTCDHLLLQTGEVQALQRAYLQFQPEIVLDGHERVWNNGGGDIQVSTSFTPMNSDDWRATALAMDAAAFTELEKNDLNGYYYSGAVNGFNPNMANAYFTTAGSLYVLMETRGIYGGNEAIERRTVAHMAAVEGILNYLHDNAAAVKTLVTRERTAFAENGATYDASNVLVLETGSRSSTAADKEAWGNLNTSRQAINWSTGVVTFSTRYPTVYDVVKRSRVAPTAYVIPADAANIDQILTQLTRHGIAYTLLPEGATLNLQHYGGTTTEATLSAEVATRFAKGCYVFTMNQEKALVLATLMEPDITNATEQKGTLAQRGLLKVSDTYRYIRDLNANGTVDYTVTDAAFVNITVWLDGTNGDDTADGMSEATAVKTLEKAYALMDAAMQSAAEGSQASLTIVGLYELGTARVGLPAANFHVTISGKTTADGFSYTGGSGQSSRIIDINGDTTFRNMTLHCNNKGNFNHINANGHKVVFDTGMNCTTIGTHYFTLAGGAYSTDTHDTTDLTVRSGKWRSIYVGGYMSHVSGLAKADISGCRVYNNIAASYRGNVGAMALTVRETDLSVDTDVAAYSNIYAGTIEYSSSSKSGAVLGDSTVILGKNVVGNGLYASSCLNGYIYGTATIIANGVDLSSFPVCATSPRRASGTTASAVLRLNKDVTGDVTPDAALPVDLNGHSITGNITIDGTLTVFDSQTDDFSVADGNYGKLTGSVSGKVVAAEGYVSPDGRSFHRIGMNINGVAIRPSVAGIYYTATWNWDEVLASNIASYGIAVSTVDMPGTDFRTDPDTLWTTLPATEYIAGGGQTSAIIANILKEGQDNDERGKADIYAAAYVVFKDGTVHMSTDNIAYSLYDVMHLAEDTVYEAKKEPLNAFYKAWEALMSTWNLTKIGK